MFRAIFLIYCVCVGVGRGGGVGVASEANFVPISSLLSLIIMFFHTNHTVYYWLECYCSKLLYDLVS